MTKKQDVLWSHCNECNQETKHQVIKLAERRREFEEGAYTVEIGTAWKVLQCRGCDEVALRRVDWCSEDDRHDGVEPTYYPPRVSRRRPDWMDRVPVPGEYLDLLDEVYKALHADSRRLAMMGARTLIDMVIQRSVGDQGNFQQGLNELESNDLISARDRKAVEVAIDAGHASAHRAHKASEADVNVVIDIVEQLIRSEALPEQAKQLAKRTPPRPQRAKKRA